MSAVPKRKLTPEEYLAIERKAPFKSEFFQGEMFAMAGANRQHNMLKEKLIGEIYARLKGGPCQSFSSDQRVKVSATGLYTYPDIVIVCGKPEYESKELDTLLNPQVIIEVLSESSESYDRGRKFRHYQQLPSVKEYLVVAQTRVQIDRFVRQADETWSLTVFDDLDKEFSLATVPVNFLLSAIYAGVELSPEPDEPTQK